MVVRSGAEGCRNDNWIWSCLGEADPDGDAFMITLALAGVVPGTVRGVRFEVNIAASSRTMEPGAYSFKVYAGSNHIATVDGPDEVGTDYVNVTISDRVFDTAPDTTITGGLKDNLDGPELEIRAPSLPYMQLTRVQFVVEHEPDGN